MKYPYGNCQHCGERLYAHVDGGYQCHNCHQRYPEDELDGATA
ncbi:hypothetical protein ACFO5R_09315 [Halosolutus amylolyticus]|uniref:Uncharacterized protein n=1 Tax=Halosolutus amylolyticus TaxID=2932267 RepID=A0ABD5PNV6_9EURY|nr:hypothetical protein [Halosolutus amylolyticus]